MNLPFDWLSPSTLRCLALSLLHFLWQGTALAALAYVAMSLCRSTATRYAAGVAVLMLMLAAPVGTFFLLHSQEQSPLIDREISATVRFAPSIPTTAPLSYDAAAHRERFTPYSLWLVELWFAGVVLLSLRSVGGILVVERLRRKDTVPITEELLGLCLALQRRMGLTRTIRFCETLRLDAPAVAGWIRPVVLLPLSALTGLTEGQLVAVIAHELAHIRRHDAFVNLFQVAVETVLFYHPAVWWLGKQVREEREHCCDDVAVEVCGNAASYAYALTQMAETKWAPDMAMAANRSPLVERIARLLGSSPDSQSFRAANLSTGVLCLSAALLAGGALMGSVHYVRAQTPASAAQMDSTETKQQSAASMDTIARAQVNASTRNTPRPAATPSTEPVAAALAAPAAQEKSAPPEPAPEPQANVAAKQSYIDSLREAGLTNLTVDELIALKVQGVTADYIKAMKQYIQSENGSLDVDSLIGLKVQGVTGDYAKAMRAATGQDLDGNELIGLKVQGVTPEYVQRMHELGLTTDAGEIIGMKVQGVTPEYVRGMGGLGMKVDPGDIIGMKVQGVTPEYVQEMRGLGLKVDSGEIIGMKVQGISPEYVKGFNAIGLHPSTDELIGMKVQGVTPEYLKAMQAAGFKMDVDEAIGAKVQGITPEFVAKVRSHGFKDLTLDKLIALKQNGLFETEK